MNLKNKPKVKEKYRREGTIKIKTLLEVTENPKGCFNNREKLLCIDIDKGGTVIMASFPYTKKGKKDLLNFIKEELYL